MEKIRYKINEMKCRYQWSVALSLILLMGLTACVSEDFDFKTDGDTNLSIMLPDTGSFDTRADEPTSPAVNNEGNFDSLWLFAFPQDGNSTNKKVIKLSNLPYTTEGRYRVYKTTINPGKYKFYLYANLDDYTSTGYFYEQNNNTTEDQLNSMVLDFSTNRPVAGKLPMVAFPQNIDNVDSQNCFTIVKEANNIVNANMMFLVSKVRHTILFDNSAGGISSQFHNNIIEFKLDNDPASVSNLNKTTPLTWNRTDRFDQNHAGWNINIGTYEYPDHENYPRSGTDNLYNWNTSQDGDWSKAGKKAWQYITYVPEDMDGETLFTHPYAISGVKLPQPKTFTMKLFFEESLKEDKYIQRSKMYDIVTPVTKSDFDYMNTTIKCMDWDLNEISYNLHGPYELIVEDTSVDVVSSGGWTILGFQSNIPDDEIWFEYPKIVVNGETYDFYVASVITPGMTDDDGNPYSFSDEWPSHLRIQVNPLLPYEVIRQMGKQSDGKYGDSYTNSAGIKYKREEMMYFHIVAANLHKRIDIDLLDLDVFLTVTPLNILINTREYYTSDLEKTISIHFETNFEDDNLQNFFKLEDTDALFAGVGNDSDEKPALQLTVDSGVLAIGTGNTYPISVKKGEVTLKLGDMFGGNEYWSLDHEYSLTFTLTVGDKVYERTVRITVKPFTTNYTIHFRDNTRPWSEPHIYVYQLLTLPSDLGEGYDSNGVKRDNSHLAGKIVGYIENNNGLQYNGAVQYVFSNNCSFRGWKGYGGPDINNPWDEARITYDYPDANNSNKSTMGFVMFGTGPDNDPYEGFWNFQYSYNVLWHTVLNRNIENPQRHQRYRYDVNFNADHEKNYLDWKCEKCKDQKNRNSDYNYDQDNGADGRFYTGISMAEENDGWWKYTLTGVAQPGRTMIIFANYHRPWGPDHAQYTPEDNRWPGDYESGLPLFDFEDNEGWLLFDGNTTNANQKFYDDKPSVDVIPHNLSAYASKMRIEVKKPAYTTVSGITVGGAAATMQDGGDRFYVEVSNPKIEAWDDYDEMTKLEVTVNTSSGNKTYKLAPKNFKKYSGGGYVTAQPLYVEFCNEILMFVKWNNYTYGQGYNPPSNEADRKILSLYWGNGSSFMKDETSKNEYGNYAYVNFNLTNPTSHQDQLQFRLKGTSDGTNTFSKTIKVEDLPKYYNPYKNPFISTTKEGYYQINLHKTDKFER